ncbi:MAG: Hsp70 family protein [Zavarzinella sp.]
MSDTIVGIDLGTTNSEIAVIERGKPVLITDENDDPILPSCVGITEDGKLLIGRPALNQYALAPERTIRSIKRKMGTDQKVKLGDTEYRPEEISALILRGLKERAERKLGKMVSKAVITVPAYFNDTQRQATIDAGALAGLEVVRILNEPTAASLVYEINQNAQMNVLVYDLGGGTFDVSIVSTESGVVEVLASHGDTALGGDDFDELFMNLLCDRFQEAHELDLRQNSTTKARVLRAAEKAKRELSDHALVRVEEEFIAEKDGVSLHMSMEITRSEYEELIQPMLERTMECVNKSLEDAKLSPEQIDRVVLVGGSTRTPMVAQLLEERLKRPARKDINPDLCVAMGAAVQGGMIAGEEIGSVLVDITPHTLGIKILDTDAGNIFQGGFEFRFAPIIKRGTPLPCSRSEIFRTVHDNQKVVEIDIYQGESTDTRKNHKVGMFNVEGLSDSPSGNMIVVQLDLNLNGVLKVSAKEKKTGLSKQITIDNAVDRLGASERDAATNRLEHLWRDQFPTIEEEINEYAEGENSLERSEFNSSSSFPTLEDAPPEGQREIVQARSLVEKAQRLREKCTEEDQEDLDAMITTVENALTERNWPALKKGCDELADVLFYLEDA